MHCAWLCHPQTSRNCGDTTMTVLEFLGAVRHKGDSSYVCHTTTGQVDSCKHIKNQ